MKKAIALYFPYVKIEIKMKINYDQNIDILRILLTDAVIEESDEVETGVIFDYDNQRNVVGIEMLDASKRNTQTRQLEYSILNS